MNEGNVTLLAKMINGFRSGELWSFHLVFEQPNLPARASFPSSRQNLESERTRSVNMEKIGLWSTFLLPSNPPILPRQPTTITTTTFTFSPFSLFLFLSLIPSSPWLLCWARPMKAGLEAGLEASCWLVCQSVPKPWSPHIFHFHPPDWNQLRICRTLNGEKTELKEMSSWPFLFVVLLLLLSFSDRRPTVNIVLFGPFPIRRKLVAQGESNRSKVIKYRYKSTCQGREIG